MIGAIKQAFDGDRSLLLPAFLIFCVCAVIFGSLEGDKGGY